MRRLRFSLLGREIWSIELSDDQTYEVDPPSGIGGGGGHNFERDTMPVDPNDRYAPWTDRTRFGFVR